MITVATKKDCTKLFRSGAFGNRNPDWKSPLAARADGYGGLVMLRSTKTGSPWCKPNLTLVEASYLIDDAVNIHGEPRDQFYVSAMLTDQESHTLIQGEVFRSPLGLTLNYTFSPKPMRLALREQSLHAYRTKAKCLLQGYMDPSSYEDLMSFLDDNNYAEVPNGASGYPTSHIVEFTTFDCPVGDSAKEMRNTIFWEVRAY